jgi:magnesium chelatase subunit I
VLAGSGNPEEGELRPQLLDRFGLHARIATMTDIAARVEIVQRRERFERDPAAFLKEMEPEQARLRKRVARAQKLVSKVAANVDLLGLIGALCVKLQIDGHRGELTIVRAAKALAAFEGRMHVTPEDIRRVAVMALRHRLRKDPLGEIDAGVRVEQALKAVLPATES